MLRRLLDPDADFHQACNQRRDDHKVQAVDLDFDFAHCDNFCLHRIQARDYQRRYNHHIDLRR